MVELKLKVSEAPDMRVVLPNRAENVAVAPLVHGREPYRRALQNRCNAVRAGSD